MEKTLAMKRAEFMQKLAQLINVSELPPFTVVDVLTITLAQIQTLANEQLAKDIKDYENASENAETESD